MKISSKVALAIVLVVAVVGGAASMLQLQRQAEAQRAEFQRTMVSAAQLLALAIANDVAEKRHERVQAVLDNISNFEERFRGVTALEVVDVDQRVVASLDPTRFNEKVADESIATDMALFDAKGVFDRKRQTLHIVAPLVLKHRLGLVRLQKSATELEHSIQRQRMTAIQSAAVMLVLMGLFLHLLHRRLVGARLTGLAKNAAAYGKGDLDVRAESEGEDEIAELGESFNTMAQAIQRYTDDLEQIIDERTAELRTANKRLEQLATTDQLTGVFNRRYFDDAARRALEVARRNERPLCVALVDTDKFKSINDTFGHPVGDEVLKVVASVLKENARKADLVARIGGEEFAILMPESNLDVAGDATERLRAALEADVAPRVPALGERLVTASFGVASLELHGDRLEDLLSAADEAMYNSKTEGRNRVTLAPPLTPES